jgi:hypothetical protein
MFTDRLPKTARIRTEYLKSDQLVCLDLPGDDRLLMPARQIEEALSGEQPMPVRIACAEFLTAAAEFYRVVTPPIRVLAARPLRVQEGGWATELFGDYHHDNKLIRVWMRTAVQKHVTSFGTFFSTLCHEFCHHLDREWLGFPHTPHTRGFYERTAALYHHARGTPPKRLFWRAVPGGTWTIDWRRTNRGT